MTRYTRIGSTVLAILLVGLTACRHYAAFIETQVDPDFSPSRQQKIFVTLPTQPSITERQLLSVLRTQLCADGFNVVRNQRESEWTLGFSFARQTYDFGSDFVGFVPPKGGIAFGSSRPHRVTDSTVFLTLFKTADFESSKQPLSIWEGYLSTSNNVYAVYRPVIFKYVLQRFGSNFYGRTRLVKDDLSHPPQCATTNSGS